MNLKAAIASYEAALEEWTSERVPHQWAIVQTNIGLTYRVIAENTRDEEALIRGIAKLQMAMNVFEEGQASHLIAKVKKELITAAMLLAEIKCEGACW